MDELITYLRDKVRLREAIDNPEDGLILLQAIYRNPEVALPVRMKAAVEALPYERPKLSVTANVSGDDFAEMLDRAIARSGNGAEVKQIDAHAGASPSPGGNLAMKRQPPVPWRSKLIEAKAVERPQPE